MKSVLFAISSDGVFAYIDKSHKELTIDISKAEIFETEKDIVYTRDLFRQFFDVALEDGSYKAHLQMFKKRCERNSNNDIIGVKAKDYEINTFNKRTFNHNVGKYIPAHRY